MGTIQTTVLLRSLSNFTCQSVMMRRGTLFILDLRVKCHGQLWPPCEGMPCLAFSSYFWFHFKVKFLTRYWRLFGLSFLWIFFAISIDFYVGKCIICIYLCNFHVYKWENAYIKKLFALRILMNFFCIYYGEGSGGGCTNACICMGTHSQPLLQNTLMDIYKTW